MGLVPPTEKQIAYANSLGIKHPELLTKDELSRAIDQAQWRLDSLEKHKELLGIAKRLGVEIPPRATSRQLHYLIREAVPRELSRKGIIEGQYVTYSRHGVCLVEKYHASSQTIILRPVSGRPKALTLEARLVAIHAKACEPPK